MKKLLFLAVGASMSISAMAQQATSKSVIMLPSENKKTIGDITMTAEELKSLTPWRNDTRAAGKTTISGSRTYNYFSLLSALNQPVQTYPYLWQNGEGMSLYQGTSGLENDTIRHYGYAAVLMPWYSLFNDKSALDYNGKIAVMHYTPYTVDTIGIYGIYGENSMKLGVIDTLIVTLVYGNGASGSDIFVNRWSGGDIKTNFGVDTLQIPDLRYDTVQHGIAGTTKVVKRIPLDANWRNDTLANGIHYFAVPFGVSVPAGNMSAVSVSFRSGDPNKPAPYTDTIFRGTANSADPYKYNMFRPAMFGENDGQYPKYSPANYNTGFMLEKIYGDTATNVYRTFSRRYVPMYFYGADADIEHPILDWVVSCANCPAVGSVQQSVGDVDNKISAVKVYPNPANTEAKVGFVLNESSNVTVSVTNLVGQVINSQSFNGVTKGEATFSTSQMVNGMYLVTIEADGFKKVERFTVAH